MNSIYKTFSVGSSLAVYPYENPIQKLQKIMKIDDKPITVIPLEYIKKEKGPTDRFDERIIYKTVM